MESSLDIKGLTEISIEGDSEGNKEGGGEGDKLNCLKRVGSTKGGYWQVIA